MRFINNVLVLATSITLVSAGCYGTGDVWVNGFNPSISITAACLQLAGNIGGTYTAGQSKSTCVNGPNNQRFDFNIKYIGSGSGNMDALRCLNGLSIQFSECTRGGSTGYESWQYTSDPNAGTC